MFFARARDATPPILVWHVRQNGYLYENMLIVTIVTALVPRVRAKDRFEIRKERCKVWRVVVNIGFMDQLGLNDLLPALADTGCDIDLEKIVYDVGHEER